MEFKGTKGKWQVSQPDGKSITDKSDNGIGYEVVVVQGVFMSKYSKIAKANALLASKAPEMIEMLNRISGEMLRSDFVLDEKWYDQIQKLINEATNV